MVCLFYNFISSYFVEIRFFFIFFQQFCVCCLWMCFVCWLVGWLVNWLAGKCVCESFFVFFYAQCQNINPIKMKKCTTLKQNMGNILWAPLFALLWHAVLSLALHCIVIVSFFPPFFRLCPLFEKCRNGR